MNLESQLTSTSLVSPSSFFAAVIFDHQSVALALGINASSLAMYLTAFFLHPQPPRICYITKSAGPSVVARACGVRHGSWNCHRIRHVTKSWNACCVRQRRYCVRLGSYHASVMLQLACQFFSLSFDVHFVQWSERKHHRLRQ